MRPIDSITDERGELSLSILTSRPACTELYFRPTEQSYRLAHGRGDPPAVKIASFDEELGQISLFPVTTSASSNLLRPKYQISEVLLDDVDFDLPMSISDVEGVASTFPEGFIREPAWGFGLQKNYQPIIQAIAKIEKVQKLILTQAGPTGLDYLHEDETAFYLTYSDYEVARLGMLRIQTHFQKESLRDREILAHNSILTQLDPILFPERTRPYKPDTIFKILDHQSNEKLSKLDRRALVDSVAARASEIANSEPEKLVQLHQEIELASLDQLLVRFDELLNSNSAEVVWQRLFSLNPFILSMAFGYSIVVVAEQASVGGTALSGSGGKLADFLVKNDRTNNVAIVEIKRPSTVLVTERAYRGEVHLISSELTGAVLQILDQRYHFSRNEPTIQSNSRSVTVEGYSIACVVIAGRIPAGLAQQKTLELYRGSLKDVIVLTFDELRQRLSSLRDFLAMRATSND